MVVIFLTIGTVVIIGWFMTGRLELFLYMLFTGLISWWFMLFLMFWVVICSGWGGWLAATLYSMEGSASRLILCWARPKLFNFSLMYCCLCWLLNWLMRRWLY